MLHQTGTISEEAWSIVPQLLKIVAGSDNEPEGGFGYEYFATMEIFFKNIFKLGNREIFTRTVGNNNYFEIVLKAMFRVIEISKTSYADGSAMIACKILTGIFENFKGQIDTYVSHILKVIIDEISREDLNPTYMQNLILVLYSSLYYNASLTFEAFQNMNCMESAIECLFGNMAQFKTLDAIKQVIYGTCSLFMLPISQIPDSIKSKMGSIVESLITLIEKYANDYTKKESASKYEEGEGDDGVDDYYDLGDDAEGEDEYDEAFDADYVPNQTNFSLYKGPFDEVLAPVYFKQVLNEISQSNQEVYSSLIELISPEQQETLEKLIESISSN